MKKFRAIALAGMCSFGLMVAGCGSEGGLARDSARGGGGPDTVAVGGAGVDASGVGGTSGSAPGDVGSDAPPQQGGSDGAAVLDAHDAGPTNADGPTVDQAKGDLAINECEAAVEPCSPDAVCTDTPSAFTCVCKPGFAGSGTTCEDVNGCVSDNGGCSVNAVCTNTPGTRVCTCKSGFSGNGTSCLDIDECATNNGGCDSLVTCTNTAGSHTCGNCPPGYSGGASNVCVDINECTADTDNCALDAGCSNTLGGFTCECKAGFTGTGVSCHACATCGAGTYQATGCTSTTDTVCSACPAGCTTCSSATTCGSCEPGLYLHLGLCIACSTCGDGQYQVSACSATQNTACATCSSCGNAQYQSVACGGSNNTTCSDCATCPVGQYATASCSASSNTVCASCREGCSACSGAGACTVCATGYVLSGGVCAKEGSSCLALLTADPSLPDGVYQLDPDGTAGAPPFLAFCDMTSDGGGWMKILQYKDQAYEPAAAAIGTIAVGGTDATAKMADADVNSLSILGLKREYRFQGATSTKKLFIKSSATWDDTARGEGLVLTGSTLACEATSNCTYVSVTTPGGRPSIDSNDWSPSSIAGANNVDRYFTDYSAPIHCFATSDSTKRCYCSGATTNHAMIHNFSIWAREIPLSNEPVITYTLNENAGTTAADTSGNAFGATVVSGSWVPGHTGSGFQGSLHTDANVPVTRSVSVSLWARRDGAGAGFARILGWANDGLEISALGAQGNLWVYLPSIGWQDTGTVFGSGFHHVGVTVGGGTVTAYYDGAKVFEIAGTANLSGKMALGKRFSGGEAWVGALDQVRVFRGVLGAAEVLLLSQE